MKRIAALLAIIAALTAGAQTIPPIVYDIEADFQQTQALPDQSFVQGAGVALRYRLKSQGRWLSLAGLGARWDARALSTSTQALQQAATVVTNVTPNYFQVLLTSAQTGSAVTNWTHSLIVTFAGTDYPIGVGRLDIAASAWTGAAAVLSNTTAAAYTDAAVATHAALKATTNSLGHIIVGDNLTVDGNGRVSAAPPGAAAWDDVTGKPATFPPHLSATQTVIRAATSAGVQIQNSSGAPALTIGAGGTGVTTADGLNVSGALQVQGTNVMTELAGKVATNDPRYLASLTNAAAFSPAGALPTTGGTMTGAIDMGTNIVTGRRFGVDAGVGASGSVWSAHGRSAGYGASGNNWSAHGNGAGYFADGSIWSAHGYYAGLSAAGDNWSAYGYFAGYGAIHTNSASFGQYAGCSARGNNRGYWDVYAADPTYAADGATNDTIFLDSDGKLYLGGGAARAENPNAGGVLRGAWTGSGNIDVGTNAFIGKLWGDVYYPNGHIALDSVERQLRDSMNQVSVDFNSPRQLIDTTGTNVVLDWSSRPAFAGSIAAAGGLTNAAAFATAAQGAKADAAVATNHTGSVSISGMFTAGSYSATITPTPLTYVTNLTISAANGMEQRITEITGPMDIVFPAGVTNLLTRIFLTIPPTGTNVVNMLPGPAYTFITPLVSTNWVGTNAYTHVWYVSEQGTTNSTAVVARGSVQ